MKEYGGYIELETFRGKEFYPELPAFNSGRTALRFLIRYRGIKKIFLPGFCCSTVWEACEAEGIPWEFYSITSDFRPIFEKSLQAQEWLYVVNFYGILTNPDVEALAARYPRLIADYTHAFFQRPLRAVDTLYSCRKFFGVADGAYLSLGTSADIPVSGAADRSDLADCGGLANCGGLADCGGLASRGGLANLADCGGLANRGSLAHSADLPDWSPLYDALPLDRSCDRMHFLLGRFEGAASDFYQEYAQNNEIFTTEPVKRMSALTRNLLRGIDYSFVCRRRTENFQYLHARLQSRNRLTLPMISGAYSYPFWYQKKPAAGSRLRKELIRQKIYVPTLWPEVMELNPEGSLEYQMTENILPLPIDQRYTTEDMDQILDILMRLFDSLE